MNPLTLDALIALGLDGIVEALPSGLMLVGGPDGDTLFSMNSQAKQLLGLTGADRRLTLLAELPPYLSPLVALLAPNQDDQTRGELSLCLPRRSEPSILGYTLKTLPTPNSHPEWGHIRAFVFSDITQVIQDRLALDRTKDELYQSKKLASLGTLVAGVAHELNNPLTGISMSADLLRRRLLKLLGPTELDPDTLRQELRQLLGEADQIVDTCGRAANLVNELLNYAKPTHLNLRRERLDVLLNQLIQAVKSHPAFSDVRFDLSLHPKLPVPWVLCERLKLEQVFYNLFKNAAEAMSGPGVITVRMAPEPDNTVSVAVTDPGPGIDPTVLNRIFDPFFTTKGANGVGLGLSISYRTVEQHGGRMSVASPPGQGATFMVSLPLQPQQDPNAPVVLDVSTDDAPESEP